MSKRLTDLEVAHKLQKHGEHCGPDDCVCDHAERVHNTFLIIRAIRLSERKECEEFARLCGSARIADWIRDRYQHDNER